MAFPLVSLLLQEADYDKLSLNPYYVSRKGKEILLTLANYSLKLAHNDIEQVILPVCQMFVLSHLPKKLN